MYGRFAICSFSLNRRRADHRRALANNSFSCVVKVPEENTTRAPASLSLNASPFVTKGPGLSMHCPNRGST